MSYVTTVYMLAPKKGAAKAVSVAGIHAAITSGYIQELPAEFIKAIAHRAIWLRDDQSICAMCNGAELALSIDATTCLVFNSISGTFELYDFHTLEAAFDVTGTKSIHTSNPLEAQPEESSPN